MYSTQFGLQEEPFRLTSDPRFFYSNAVYQEAYASLFYGIEQRKGLVVLTGETGTGKTTLLKVLMNNLEARIRWLYIGQAIPTFEELLDFYLPGTSAEPRERWAAAENASLARFSSESVSTWR